MIGLGRKAKPLWRSAVQRMQHRQLSGGAAAAADAPAMPRLRGLKNKNAALGIWGRAFFYLQLWMAKPEQLTTLGPLLVPQAPAVVMQAFEFWAVVCVGIASYRMRGAVARAGPVGV